MNISGVLVHARPEHLQQVCQHLVAIAGVEVHATTPDGRLIVTVEDETDGAMADTVIGFQNLAGVLNAALIYQCSDSFDCNSEVLEKEGSSPL